MEEVEYKGHGLIVLTNQQVLMSQHIYAVLPYDSGIRFNPKDVVQCVFGFKVPELTGIEAELCYSDLADGMIFLYFLFLLLAKLE
ncbi:MAG: hypothetical protein ACI4A7_00675 [Prevotella sp.]